MSRNALGRGLSALLQEGSPVPKPEKPDSKEEFEPSNEIPVKNVRPNRFQPRKTFDSESIKELADSIKAHGLIQPIVVSYDSKEDEYELIAGERRYEACKSLKMDTIAAIIQDVDDESRLELGLIENIQREDLNPIEEAQAYKLLMEKFDLTQEKAALRLGKKRTSIANSLRMLNLPEDIIVEIATGALSPGHAKALASIEDEFLLREAIQQLRQGSLTVRQTETLVRDLKTRKAKKPGKHRQKQSLDPNMIMIEESLQNHLGTKVKIHAGKGTKGKIEIEYYTAEDLERIMDVIGVEFD